MEYILVTGAAGFIGSHLCERLISLGFGVIGIDNFDPFYARSLKEKNLSTLVNNVHFTLFEADLRDSDLDRLLENFSFKSIVHLAGKVGVRPSIDQPQDYIDHNVSVTLRVLEYAKRKGIKKFVFASSSSIYGNNQNAPWSESLDVSEPISPYAFSKRSCELLNYSYHHLYNIDILNLRFFTVYGPRQRPDLAIAKFFKLIKEQLPLPVYGDGSTKRDYTFISDIIDGIILSLGYLKDHNNVYEIINLGNGNPIEMRGLVRELKDAFHNTVNIEYFPEQLGDVKLTAADISKARKLINFDPKVEFKVGLQIFADSIR